MKVFLVMEILHDFQVGLQSFNLMGEVFGDLLDRLVAGKEVEHLIDVSSKVVPNSSISLVLKVVQSVMLLKSPCLVRGMAWRVRATLTTSPDWVNLNPFRMVDNQG